MTYKIYVLFHFFRCPFRDTTSITVTSIIESILEQNTFFTEFNHVHGEVRAENFINNTFESITF